MLMFLFVVVIYSPFVTGKQRNSHYKRRTALKPFRLFLQSIYERAELYHTNKTSLNLSFLHMANYSVKNNFQN